MSGKGAIELVKYERCSGLTSDTVKITATITNIGDKTDTFQLSLFREDGRKIDDEPDILLPKLEPKKSTEITVSNKWKTLLYKIDPFKDFEGYIRLSRNPSILVTRWEGDPIHFTVECLGEKHIGSSECHDVPPPLYCADGYIDLPLPKEAKKQGIPEKPKDPPTPGEERFTITCKDGSKAGWYEKDGEWALRLCPEMVETTYEGPLGPLASIEDNMGLPVIDLFLIIFIILIGLLIYKFVVR